MEKSATMKKYSIQARILHWLMAAVILSALGLGIYMTNLGKDATNRMQIYNLHKSLGVTVMILVLIRIAIRLKNKPPALPTTIKAIERKLANGTHHILYLLMILVPLSGYLMSSFFGFPVHLFSLEIPMLVSANPTVGKFFAEAHEILAYALLGVITLHALGAFKHLFDGKENNVLRRMI